MVRDSKQSVAHLRLCGQQGRLHLVLDSDQYDQVSSKAGELDHQALVSSVATNLKITTLKYNDTPRIYSQKHFTLTESLEISNTIGVIL